MCRIANRTQGRAFMAPYGPGTDLASLFNEVGIEEKPDCNCRAIAAEMDRYGVAGCRERRDHFIGLLRENEKLYTQWEKAKAAPRGLALGIVSLAGFFDEAVRRAAAKDAWQPVRHCLYHIAALRSNDDWRRNVEQIKKRWQLFDGRRVIAYATGDLCYPLHEVRSELPEATIIEVPNDPQLREVASFRRLLQEVAGMGGITFYAHTKGNSTAENVTGAKRWRNAMYRFLLDDPEQVRRALTTHTFCGTHKMTWELPFSPFPSRLKVGTWMHAGTFFWFRNDRVFSSPRWRDVPSDRYGAEAWPSVVCPNHAQAFSLYQPWPATERRPNPYNPSLYPAEFDDA